MVRLQVSRLIFRSQHKALVQDSGYMHLPASDELSHQTVARQEHKDSVWNDLAVNIAITHHCRHHVDHKI